MDNLSDPNFDFSDFEPAEPGITDSDIQQHVGDLLEGFKPISHNILLNQLLEKVKEVDFRELAGLNGESSGQGESLKKKHFLVCAVEQVLLLAQQNNWGICRNYDFIYLYNGAYWSLLDTDELKTFLGEAAERMGIDKFDARYYLFRDQLYKQFLATAILPKPDYPKDTVLINLTNGTFEVTTKGVRLREFRRQDFLTYQLPFEYNPQAKAPMFEKYLDRVLPEKELQNILAEFLAYIFTRNLKLEKCLLLYGQGANGKSVFFDVVNALLGEENFSSYSLQSLTDETGYYRAKLANRLLNYASEISGNLRTDIFKNLVSGEPVEARLPYGQPFILTNYAKLVFNCNELPKDVEHNEAYFRRFLIIPFNVTIPEEEQDRELAKKIIESELSGVFNWVLKGLERLLDQRNFTNSSIITETVAGYKRQSDSVQIFLEDNEYIQSIEGYKPLKEIYAEYRLYCGENGYRPCANKTFGDRLRNIGIHLEKKNFGQAVFIEKK